MKRSAFLVPIFFALSAVAVVAAEGNPTRVLGAGKLPDDQRLGKAKDLNGYFPMRVPASKEAWETRRKDLREQVLVGNGLWPMPEKQPLKPVIHGKIDREGYTVEKVYFASLPGHYVTGNLYRPKGKNGKLAGVLCPHGHWANGRFYEATEAAAKQQIAQGAEKTLESARYPLQARCAQLARMGCVVFHYDMVGYADSKPIPHRAGFTDAEAELRLQSFMGLQTYNNVRALDFLLGLPDVDAKRIGVTGASGGGTQTFLLCAIDDRPAAAFPAVMVSTAMQGGCVCENCSYLRQGAGNIDLAGLFVPKPLAMSGANDWTIDIETKGLPELKSLYKLYGAEDKVLAKCYPQFGHNYNQVSRELMCGWFNKHLDLGHQEPIAEQPFVPVAPKDLSVFDAEHPLPGDAVDAARLRQVMTEQSDKQLNALRPRDAESLKEYRRVVGAALRVMIHDRLPAAEEVEEKATPIVEEKDGVRVLKVLLGRKGEKEQVPALGLRGAEFDGVVVVWVHPEGKASLFPNGKLAPAAKRLLDRKAAILAPDVTWTGESQGVVFHIDTDAKKLQAVKLTAKDFSTALEKVLPAGVVNVGNNHLLAARDQEASLLETLKTLSLAAGGKDIRLGEVATIVRKDRLPVNTGYAGFTYGYNRPLLADRVHDILTAIGYARNHQKAKEVFLLGLERSGPWVVLAGAAAGDAVARTAADLDGFRFEKVQAVDGEMMLPGALKYGGLPALAALNAPGQLYLHNVKGTGDVGLVKDAYKAAGAQEGVKVEEGKASAEKAVEWLVR